MKLNKSTIKELAQKALASGNPYLEGATKYFIGNETRYLAFEHSYTKEELDAEYIKTASKDIEAGYEQRMVGYYDKWYRYCRKDEGRAYDLGCKMALESPKCSAELNIIPCIH